MMLVGAIFRRIGVRELVLWDSKIMDTELSQMDSFVADIACFGITAGFVDQAGSSLRA